jgi:hypothetical protein
MARQTVEEQLESAYALVDELQQTEARLRKAISTALTALQGEETDDDAHRPGRDT